MEASISLHWQRSQWLILPGSEVIQVILCTAPISSYPYADLMRHDYIDDGESHAI